MSGHDPRFIYPEPKLGPKSKLLGEILTHWMVSIIIGMLAFVLFSWLFVSAWDVIYARIPATAPEGTTYTFKHGKWKKQPN